MRAWNLNVTDLKTKLLAIFCFRPTIFMASHDLARNVLGPSQW